MARMDQPTEEDSITAREVGEQVEQVEQVEVLMTTLALGDSEALAALQRFVIAPILLERLG